MQDRFVRRYDMFFRVETFGANNLEDFAAGGDAHRHFANLTRIRKEIDKEKSRRPSVSTAALENLYNILRSSVQNITRTARAIAQDEPGFSDGFRPPESSSHSSLLTSADAILGRLAEAEGDTQAEKSAKAALTARFIAKEFPADFVTALAKERADLENARTAAQGGDNLSVESTAIITRLIKEGMKEVNYLDAIIHNKYSRNAEKLRAWQSASHIERAPKREKKPPAEESA